MITTQITSLKGAYVICKRVRKVPFYWRGDNYSKTSTTARHAARFDTKEAAQAKCKEIEDKRKADKKGGHKFRVEDAEKHFVNSFVLQFESWHKKIVIKNEMKAIQYVTEYKHKVSHSLNAQKDSVLEQLKRQIDYENAQIKQAEDSYKQAQAARLKSIEEVQKTMQHLVNTDLDATYVEPNLTKTDKTVAVLYGSKQETKSSSNGTMILLGGGQI